ncbi:DeoR family fructose operon transcriptional repressor [Bradyrhizobium sp. USDA 4369]
MWAKDRHHLIISKLAANEHIGIDALVEELQVSRETIRRDIITLEAEGKLRRLHGGVARVDASAEPPFEARLKVNAAAKRKIGLAAARLVEPGMLVAIDAGTTTLAFADAIVGIPDVSVVTNSFDIARTIVTARPHADVVLLGGRIGNHVPGTFGELTVAEIRRFSPDMGVFSPVALSAQQGATDFHLVEAEFANAMIACSKRTVVLADHTKLDEVSRVRICDCNQIDVLVTDKGASQKALKGLLSAGLGEAITD